MRGEHGIEVAHIQRTIFRRDGADRKTLALQSRRVVNIQPLKSWMERVKSAFKDEEYGDAFRENSP